MSEPKPIPAQQRAIVQDTSGRPQLRTDIPVPVLLPGTILVETIAVALNPSDFKMGQAFPTPNAIIGSDYAGIIRAISPSTNPTDPAGRLQVGDLVSGIVHGSNPIAPEAGAFAQFIRAPADLAMRIPPAVPPQDATAMGIGLATNCLALWDALALPASPVSPAPTPFPVLVYGGSTATGTLALQLLRLSNLEPIAVCSARHHALALSCGASVCFDHTDAKTDIAAAIRAHTANRLGYALDCISDGPSATTCYAALGRVGGRYAHLELGGPGPAKPRRVVKAEFVMAPEVFGHEVALGNGYERPANEERHRKAVEWFKVFEGLLAEGKIRPHPVQMMEGGLGGVLEGLELLRSGSVSGKKLVALV